MLLLVSTLAGWAVAGPLARVSDMVVSLSSLSTSMQVGPEPTRPDDDRSPAPTQQKTQAPTPPPAAATAPVFEQLVVDANAARCPDVYVYIVSDWVDGGAQATIALGRNSRGYVRRVGGHIGQYEVVSISSGGYGLNPTVWLADGSEVCKVLLFDDNPVRRKARARRAKARKKKKKKRRRRR